MEYKGLTEAEIDILLDEITDHDGWFERKAAATIERLRLERDVLALNFGQKDSGVVIMMDESRIAGVTWIAAQSASGPSVRLPSYL